VAGGKQCANIVSLKNGTTAEPSRRAKGAKKKRGRDIIGQEDRPDAQNRKRNSVKITESCGRMKRENKQGREKKKKGKKENEGGVK